MALAGTLYRLQQLDTEFDQIRRRVAEIDQGIKGSPALTHTRAEFAAAEKAHQKAQAALKMTELEVQTLDDKISGEEKRLYTGAIKNPKEMIEVEAEVASLKRRRQGLEEQQLAHIEAAEDARASEARCRQALAQAEKQHAIDAEQLKIEKAGILKRVLAQAEQRNALVAAVSKADAELYQTLRAKKQNGVAVVAVRDGACGGCGTEVNSSHAQQAHNGAATVTCTNCGRILFAA